MYFFIIYHLLIFFSHSLYCGELYILKYGESQYPLKYTNRAGEGKARFGWYFYLFVEDNFKLLIDSGTFDSTQIKNFSIQNYKNPIYLLSKLNLKIEDITDIFISHIHFDHIGDLILFPQAKIHINLSEYEDLKLKKYYSRNKKYFKNAYDNNRILTYLGDLEIYKNIKIIQTGGHTIGSQALEIKFPDFDVLITGDECYFINECRNGIGTFPSALFSVSKNKVFMEKVIQKVKTQNSKIFTFHDTEIENYFRMDPLHETGILLKN